MIKRSLLVVVALFTYWSATAQSTTKPNLESKGIEDIMQFQLYEPKADPRPRLPKVVLANLSFDYGVTTMFNSTEGGEHISVPSFGIKAGFWTSTYAGIEIGYSSYDGNFAKSIHGAEEWAAMKEQLIKHNLELSYLFHATNYLNEAFAINRFYVVGVAGVDLGKGGDYTRVGVHGAFRGLYNIKATPVTLYVEPRVGFNFTNTAGSGRIGELSSTSRVSFGIELSLTGEKGKPNLARFTAEAAKTMSRLLYDFSLSAGAETIISPENIVENARFFSRLGVGVTLSKTSGFEFGLSLYDMAVNDLFHSDGWAAYSTNLPTMGFDASYRLDIVNAVRKNDDFKFMGVDLIAGLDTRWGNGVSAYGGHVAPRISINYNNYFSLFAEPRLTVLSSEDLGVVNAGRSVHFIPSFSVGARVNINRQYDDAEKREILIARDASHEKSPTLYLLGSIGGESMLKSNISPAGSMIFTGKAGVGLYLSEVSAIEAKAELYKFPFTASLHANSADWAATYYDLLPDFGLSFAYRYNITSAIRKSNEHGGLPVAEVSALAGVTLREGGGSSVVGANISSRLSLNVSRTIAFFMEPRMSLLYGNRFSEIADGNLQLLPSVDLGMEYYVNRRFKFKQRGYGLSYPIYLVGSMGAEAVSNSVYDFSNTLDATFGAGLGAYISPVSAFEARLDLYNTAVSESVHKDQSWGDTYSTMAKFGMSLLYRYNITAAYRQETKNLSLFEVSALGGVQARIGSNDVAFGPSASLRGSINVTNSFAIFAEPKYSVLYGTKESSITDSHIFKQPSVNLGIELYLNRNNLAKRRGIQDASVLYILGSAGVEGLTNGKYGYLNSMYLAVGGGAGTYISDVSAIEGRMDIYNFPSGARLHGNDDDWNSKYTTVPNLGLSLSYRYNVTNALNRRSNFLPLFEVSALAGVQSRLRRAEATVGYQVSLRGSVNVSNTVSFFAEPKYSVQYGKYTNLLSYHGVDAMNTGSMSFGMEVYLNRNQKSAIRGISNGPTLYLVGWGGVEMITNCEYGLKSSMNLMLGGGFGTYVSKVSALEAHAELYRIPFTAAFHADENWTGRYYGYSGLPIGAVTLRYRYNLTNYLRGEREGLPLYEMSLLAGPQIRLGAKDVSLGYQISARGSINASKTVSFFVEPKFSSFYSGTNKYFTTGSSAAYMPSVNVGMEVYLHRSNRK